MAIGQTGSIDTSGIVEGQEVTITFSNNDGDPITLDDPVIVLTGTQQGGDPYTLRVTEILTDPVSGEATGFRFLLREWEYLDGDHPAAETVNWLAVEEGVHELPDGRIIEAGTIGGDTGNTAVNLNGNFGTTPPVVVTSVNAPFSTTAVDSDPLNITATGFDVSLQTEEALAGTSVSATIGYIAVQPSAPGADDDDGTAQNGIDINSSTATVPLGASFDDPIVVADTQTINGGNPEVLVIENGPTATSIGLSLQEEQSGDSETNHIDEEIGVIAFNRGLIFCFTGDTRVATPRGDIAVRDLTVGDWVLTRDNGPQPLRWVCTATLGAAALARAPNLRPVRIAAGSLGPGVPVRDMLVSPQHRMLVTGWRTELLFNTGEVLAPARSLGPVAPEVDEVTYYHLMFDNHEIVISDGTPSESLHPGQLDRGHVDAAAREELFSLFPSLRTETVGFGPLARPSLTVREGRLLRAG
ncbi:MAG: Hint domain-containing protein [Rhodobacteraceae bacterium]|nr:Hint domain-containing protein [Paracoccaceae bacterium]